MAWGAEWRAVRRGRRRWGQGYRFQRPRQGDQSGRADGICGSCSICSLNLLAVLAGAEAADASPQADIRRSALAASHGLIWPGVRGRQAPAGRPPQRRPQRLLEHYEVVAEQLGVVCSLAGPVKCGHKEPAGTAFHTTVLRQAGLLGALRAYARCLMPIVPCARSLQRSMRRGRHCYVPAPCASGCRGCMTSTCRARPKC